LRYALEMGSGAMICMPSAVNIGSGIQNLIRGIHRHTCRQHGDVTILLYFFKIRTAG
jgi:hypothetical protein